MFATKELISAAKFAVMVKRYAEAARANRTTN
jgi:hypothetical protein